MDYWYHHGIQIFWYVQDMISLQYWKKLGKLTLGRWPGSTLSIIAQLSTTLQVWANSNITVCSYSSTLLGSTHNTIGESTKSLVPFRQEHSARTEKSVVHLPPPKYNNSDPSYCPSLNWLPRAFRQRLPH